jgi:FHA domain/Domain of unknown function (DUF1707)
VDHPAAIVHDPRMRASDRARERTARLLRRRCDEGYLSLDTFEDRLEGVFRAREVEELAVLTEDLPAIGILDRIRQWRIGRRSAPPPQGVRLPLELIGERPVVLGRSRRCDVVLDDETVSRIHAELRRGHDGWYLRDLSSSNGTCVDGRPIARAERVYPGARIRLGGCQVLLL